MTIPPVYNIQRGEGNTKNEKRALKSKGDTTSFETWESRKFPRDLGFAVLLSTFVRGQLFATNEFFSLVSWVGSRWLIGR